MVGGGHICACVCARVHVFLASIDRASTALTNENTSNVFSGGKKYNAFLSGLLKEPASVCVRFFFCVCDWAK